MTSNYKTMLFHYISIAFPYMRKEKFNTRWNFIALLAQIKTTRVALDFNVGVDGSICMRISEIDDAPLFIR